MGVTGRLLAETRALLARQLVLPFAREWRRDLTHEARAYIEGGRWYRSLCALLKKGADECSKT